MSHGAVGRVTAPLLTAMGAAAAVGVVAAVDPERPGHYPTCPFLALTGWYCPGCGSLRALHALAHGDVLTAVDRNVLLVLAVPVLLGSWLRWARRSWRGERRATAAPSQLLWALVAVLLAYWLVRNLAVGAWLAP